ncbi:MAG: hypothetical protein LBL93_05660 [Ruminococcus sp.]|jgi:hypothetical protein|nr:hypothetical protein [Ruminococcus sp.]
MKKIKPYKIELTTSEKEARTKHILACVNSIVILTFFIIVTPFLVFGHRPTESEIEKRELAEFPKFSWSALWSGEYTSDISAYFNDTVPKREVFKNWTANIKSIAGVGNKDDVKIIGGKAGKPDNDEDYDINRKDDYPVTTPVVTGIYPAAPPKTTPVTTVPVTAPPEEEDDGEGVMEHGVFLCKDGDKYRAMSPFYGNLNAGKNYAAYVNAYKADLGAKVKVYSMVAPTSQTFYMPKKYREKYGSEPENIDYINTNLNGVIGLNICNTLMAHKKEDIYLRTDHHWAALGAYYAAQEFAAAADVPFADISTYEKCANEGYVGTFYSYSQSADILNNPETFYYYKPSNISKLDIKYFHPDGKPWGLNEGLIWKTSVSNSYTMFCGGDEKINVINTDVKNGRVLTVFKDSYGNALQPFLTGSFEKIIVIDVRYFKLNSINYLKQNGVTDVLFCMNTFSALGKNAKGIEKIRLQ